MNFFKDNFVKIIIISGLLSRILLLGLAGFKIDMDAWFAWSERLASLPFSQFYSDAIWTNYTPGYLYVLYLLGILKSLFTIDDGFYYYAVLKLPAIVAEIVLTVFVYKKVLVDYPKWAKIAALVIILNPALFFNSAVWGQIDGFLTLMMVLSVYFLDKRNLFLSSIFLGISFLIKPQAIALLPAYGIFLIRNMLIGNNREHTIKNIIQIIFPAIFIIFLFSWPFFPEQPLLGIFNLFLKMMKDYSFTSLYAYNFWGAMGFWIPDNLGWLNISYKIWGYILLMIFWFWVFLFGRKKLSAYSLAVLATLSFFFLPTRVHERYLYPALVFLIIVASKMKSLKLLILTLILSLIHFLNLYFVYVYYNEVYNKLPKILYNPILYNFLDKYGAQISVLQTAVFILISGIIIRHSDVSKKG